jgi:four helix bundle protein
MAESNDSRTYDLAERTAQFGEAVIRYASTLPRNAVCAPLISQLVKSGTSIGSNYCEADEAGSKKEFRYRISVCCRECRETKYWFRMNAAAVPAKADEARILWKEADELNRIFAAIHRKTDGDEAS